MHQRVGHPARLDRGEPTRQVVDERRARRAHVGAELVAGALEGRRSQRRERGRPPVRQPEPEQLVLATHPRRLQADEQLHHAQLRRQVGVVEVVTRQLVEQHARAVVGKQRRDDAGVEGGDDVALVREERRHDLEPRRRATGRRATGRRATGRRGTGRRHPPQARQVPGAHLLRLAVRDATESMQSLERPSDVGARAALDGVGESQRRGADVTVKWLQRSVVGGTRSFRQVRHRAAAGAAGGRAQQSQHRHVDSVVLPRSPDDGRDLLPPRHLDVERRQHAEQGAVVTTEHERDRTRRQPHAGILPERARNRRPSGHRGGVVA